MNTSISNLSFASKVKTMRRMMNHDPLVKFYSIINSTQKVLTRLVDSYEKPNLAKTQREFHILNPAYPEGKSQCHKADLWISSIFQTGKIQFSTVHTGKSLIELKTPLCAFKGQRFRASK